MEIANFGVFFLLQIIYFLFVALTGRLCSISPDDHSLIIDELQASEDYQAEKETLCSILPIRAPTVFLRLPDGAAWIFLPPYATAGIRTHPGP